MSKISLAGIYPILATTFTDDGSLDFTSQTRLIEYLLEKGAHGLGLFGNASEGYALTEPEKRQLLRLTVKQVAGRIPLVVSTGSNGTRAAVESGIAAEGDGASALMVLPPFYMRTDSNGLMRYYEAISAAVQIPIMVQDAPLMTQVAMPADLLARMCLEIEHVEYAKIEGPPTAPKITATLALANGRLTAFGGLNGQFLYEELARGAQGSMPASDMTAIYRKIWDRFHEGARMEAWKLFVHALPLMRFELQPGLGVSAVKHNLVAAGVIRSAAVRHPTGTLKPESLKELEFLRDWIEQALRDAVSA